MALGNPLDVIPGAHLNAREIQILNGLARGLTSRQIGTELGITETTVWTYGKRIRIKLQAHNTPHAVALGFVRGYLAVRPREATHAQR